MKQKRPDLEKTGPDDAFSASMWFVTLTRLNRAHRHVLGEQDYGSTGDIHIPAVAGPRILAKFGFEEGCSLRQLLRHEWAHALAHHHHHLVANREFRLAFDGSHDCGRAVPAYCPTRHISPYASTEPMEDFAENFMHFVKHRGVLPVRWQTQHIEKRWEFLHNIPRKAA